MRAAKLIMVCMALAIPISPASAGPPYIFLKCELDYKGEMGDFAGKLWHSTSYFRIGTDDWWEWSDGSWGENRCRPGMCFFDDSNFRRGGGVTDNADDYPNGPYTNIKRSSGSILDSFSSGGKFAWVASGNCSKTADPSHGQAPRNKF